MFRFRFGETVVMIEHDGASSSRMIGVDVDRRLDVFSACPPSLGEAEAEYLGRVEEVARWSERHGCRGILVYTDNRLADPWLVSQVIVRSTDSLSPLVAVQPAYMHPYTVAKMIATFSLLHERRLFINWVAGGFKNDLEALADPTPHDARYDRLLEYASIVRRLTDGEVVTFGGSYYQTRGLKLQPSVPPGLRPTFMVSGSSPAGIAAAERLGARAVTYALPSDEPQVPPYEPGLSSGLRLGIIARPRGDEAWREAYGRFPPDREGQVMRNLARKVSDSRWHEDLCRAADEDGTEGSPYWMVPFENYRTMCPYLVGTHEDVANEVTDYIARGFRTFILDDPGGEADLANAKAVFALAGKAVEEAA